MAKCEEKWEETVPGVAKENGEAGCSGVRAGLASWPCPTSWVTSRRATASSSVQQRYCTPQSVSNIVRFYSGCSASRYSPTEGSGGVSKAPTQMA